MSDSYRRLIDDDSGATLVEFTAVALFFFSLLFAVVEFSHAYYRWNAATKAVQLGARLAAVSNPVSTDMTSWDGFGLPSKCYKDSNGVASDDVPGAFVNQNDSDCVFSRVCTTESVTGATGTCTGGSYSAAAMQSIVFGRGKTTCATATSSRDLGMCNLFLGLTADKVEVRYQFTGLGYVGRPGGAVPTITVSLRNVTFDFILMGAFLGTNSITMPGFATTVTGEDLNAAWSSG